METVPLDEAWVLHPTALATDAEGSLYFVNQGAFRVRKVDRWGRVSTVAGSGLLGYSGDGGPATEAALNEPYAVTDDDVGNLYVADSKNRIVRKVVLDGTISTAAGRVPFGLPDGNQVPCAAGSGAGPDESDRAARWCPVRAARSPGRPHRPGLF